MDSANLPTPKLFTAMFIMEVQRSKSPLDHEREELWCNGGHRRPGFHAWLPMFPKEQRRLYKPQRSAVLAPKPVEKNQVSRDLTFHVNNLCKFCFYSIIFSAYFSLK